MLLYSCSCIHVEQYKLPLKSLITHLPPASNHFMNPYLASKTAIRTYGEGLSAALQVENIAVTVINPGMVESRMTREQSSAGVTMMSLWALDKAVGVMAEGIRVQKPEISFPFHMFLGSRLMGITPTWMRNLILPIVFMFDPYFHHDKRLRDLRDADKKAK